MALRCCKIYWCFVRLGNYVALPIGVVCFRVPTDWTLRRTRQEITGLIKSVQNEIRNLHCSANVSPTLDAVLK